MKTISIVLLFSLSFFLVSCSTTATSTLEDFQISALNDSIQNYEKEISSITSSEDTVHSRIRFLELSQKVLNTKSKVSHNYIMQAGRDFRAAYLAPAAGVLISGIIAGISMKSNNNINAVAVIPAIIGGVIGICSAFSASSNLENAGEVINK